MLLLALSTGHKLGLGLAVLVFAGFSLVSSMVIPRRRPQYPGRRLPVFLAAAFLLFLGMLAAVEIFGKSASEAANAKPSAPAKGTPVAVRESEFKIQLPKTTFAAGLYSFVVKNDGKIQHDLVVSGPAGKKGTTKISPGGGATLTVQLRKGQYDFYCSIPGHKQLGMDQKVTVS